MRKSIDGNISCSRPLAYALALLVLGFSAAAATWASETSDSRLEISDLTTGIGEVRLIDLAKGLKVRLNTGTHVRVRGTGSYRAVELVAGECMFELEPNTGHTLEVNTTSVVVSDGNARFDVKRDAHSTTVVVIDGTAVVHRRPKELKPLRLQAGEEVEFPATRESVRFRRMNEVDQMRRTAWTQGRLWFEGEPLSRVVAQINRYNDRRLVIGDPSLDSISISGVFRPTDITNFLKALAPFGIQPAESDTPTAYSDLVLVSSAH